MNNKISAIVIVKDEENMIVDCLESLSFCDEIILIDGGSSDRTLEIAEKMGVKVFTHKTENFSDLRNFGMKKAANEWLLYVDADERVTAELVSSIKYQVLSIKSNFSAYKIQRKNFYLGNHEWPYIEKLERLFDKSKIGGWRGELHETPIFEGKVSELDGFLLHYTHRDLTSMLNKTIEWSAVEARLRFDAHHPKMTWWRFPRVMMGAFLNSYISQGGWKVGTAGLIESIYQSFSMFVTYAKLWELQNKLKNEN